MTVSPEFGFRQRVVVAIPRAVNDIYAASVVYGTVVGWTYPWVTSGMPCEVRTYDVVVAGEQHRVDAQLVAATLDQFLDKWVARGATSYPFRSAEVNVQTLIEQRKP